MAKNFSDLKKNAKSSLEKLSEQLSKVTTPSYTSVDERFWYPERDKSGNGYAVIRFLDAPPNEDNPFVRLWEHSFQGASGSWYIEKCLTTLGKPDPVAEYNNALWNSGQESDKTIARAQKRKLYFISNVLVVKDPAHPENEGKVFLFRYGKKLFEKLNDLMNPPEGLGDEKVNPFDFWKGANLKLKIRTVDKYPNYDMSSFDNPTPVAKTDDDIKAIWEKCYSLQTFLDESNFKSYDELKAKFNKVLGKKSESSSDDNEVVAPKANKKVKEDAADDEDDLDARAKFFAKLKEDEEVE